MPKVNDIKAYWKELAQKNGIDDETLNPLLEALDKKDNFRKAFTEGFKPLPDYSHDLDDVRDKASKAKEQEYKDWYDDTKKKYDEYLKSEAELRKYREKYGTAEGAPVNTNGLTKEEVMKMMQEEMGQRLNQRDGAYMDLLEIREQHLGSFKKPLDVKSFETAWKDHPEWGNSMKQAYKSFVEPEMEKVRETEFNTRLQQKYDEGLRDGFSRRSLPTDSASKTFSPLFDRKEDVGKLSEREQETHSKQAFFDGLRDQKPA